MTKREIEIKMYRKRESCIGKSKWQLIWTECRRLEGHLLRDGGSGEDYLAEPKPFWKTFDKNGFNNSFIIFYAKFVRSERSHLLWLQLLGPTSQNRRRDLTCVDVVIKIILWRLISLIIYLVVYNDLWQQNIIRKHFWTQI